MVRHHILHQIHLIHNGMNIIHTHLPKKPLTHIINQVMNTPPWMNPNPMGQNPYSKWYSEDKTTLHAVPFLRDNIKPTTFSVKKRVKSSENDLRMFINFPNGLPIRYLDKRF